jgi:hypothetical protein
MLASFVLAAENCDPAKEACRGGPGTWLRVLVVVSVLGVVALAWILLSGYRDQDGD